MKYKTLKLLDGREFNDIFIEEIENPTFNTKGYIRKCDCCGKEFKTFSRKALICERHQLFCFCKNNNCHKKIILKKYATSICSRKCNIAVLKQAGNCSICGRFNEERDQNGRDRSNCNCSKEWFQKHNSSKEMVEQSKRLGKSNISQQHCSKHGLTIHFNNVCVTCHNQSEHMREQARIQGKLQHKIRTGPGYCQNKECNNPEIMHESRSILGFCEECNSINSTNNLLKYTSKYCDNCEINTPHDKEDKCKICETNELMWCNKCKCFGSITRHSDPNHTVYYKLLTKNWIEEYPEQIKSINWFTKDDLNVSGIYGWFVLDKCIYIGESTNILSRTLDHLYNIYHYPEYYYYEEELGIELKILEITEDNLLEKEIVYINKLSPLSQKCNGTDKIKELKER